MKFSSFVGSIVGNVGVGGIYMKSHMVRKSSLIAVFFVFFVFWLDMTGHNRQVCDTGVNALSIMAYIVALVWMIASYRNRKNQQRFFWLFFALGISFLLISKLVSSYNQLRFGLPHSPGRLSLFLYRFYLSGQGA